MKVKETFSIDKKEMRQILIEYLSKKGFDNITSLNITISSDHSHDLIRGCGYIGMVIDVENTREID